MALPSSGTLTMAQINAEFGRGNNLNAYRGTTYYTSGGGPFTFSSGAISFSNFYGTTATSPTFSFSISSHIDRANLRSLAVAAGWNGSSAVVATLTGGYYLYSTTTQAALTIDGSWPGGVTFVNNGYVMGLGGTGGGGTINTTGNVYIYNTGLSAGSDAIALGVSCTIQNNSYIGGGGGGGGCVPTGIGAAQTGLYSGGGGAGGGPGGTGNIGNPPVAYPGGAGGGIGASGGGAVGTYTQSGGGGGRIMPGSDTVATATNGAASATSIGGGGGNAGSAYGNGVVPTSGTVTTTLALGGSGGGSGAATGGYSYGAYNTAAGGGGGWGASGAASYKAAGTAGGGTTQPGAGGGYCVRTNGYGVTWSATGTRYGSIG
jgi:hypothetical protein